jgi:HNH endonuclease
MTTSSNRHKMVEQVCEWCNTKFMVRKQRVDVGLGRFCSKACFDNKQREDAKSKHGFEKGIPYLDKSKNRWNVHWYDDNGKVHCVSYARWWWIVNEKEIPDGYMISYIDGNFLNIDPSNFECIPSENVRWKAGHQNLGVEKPSMQGEKSRWWTGGRSYEYPLRFSKSLKRRIKTRDNYTCQACFTGFPTYHLDVHHKDRNKEHNSDDNLITLCKDCHRAVHGKENRINPTIEFLKSLLPKDE